jgi:hypothetical protein
VTHLELACHSAFAGEIASMAGCPSAPTARHYALYLGDVTRPADAPKALTPGPERVTWGGFTRDERAVLFQRDVGADENFHLYRVDLRGAGILDLTPGDGIRFDEPTLPRGRADVLVTTRRTTASPRSTVVVVPVAGGALRRYEDLPLPSSPT